MACVLTGAGGKLGRLPRLVGVADAKSKYLAIVIHPS